MRQRVYIITTGVLACLCLGTMWQLFRISNEIKQSYAKVVTLQAIDAKTNKPVLMTLGMPAVSQGQRWPRDMSVASYTADPLRLEFKWIGVEPVQVSVESDGYETKWVTLDKQSSPEVVISLSRSHDDAKGQ